jgi:hypothetical protein
MVLDTNEVSRIHVQGSFHGTTFGSATAHCEDSSQATGYTETIGLWKSWTMLDLVSTIRS